MKMQIVAALCIISSNWPLADCSYISGAPPGWKSIWTVGKPMKKGAHTKESAPVETAHTGKKKKKKRFSLSTLLLVLILLAGIAVLLYPTVSDWWNSMHATRAIAGYETAVEQLTAEEKEAIFESARRDILDAGTDWRKV